MAGPPTQTVRIPDAVRALAGSAPPQPVWQNALGGLTFVVESATARVFVKWAPHGCGLDLVAEAARLRWAGAFVPVPRVLDEGRDDVGAWLVTSPLSGSSAVDEHWREDAETAVAAVGHGLRVLHDRLPVGDCPFSWSLRRRLEVARARAAEGHQAPSTWHPAHRGLTVAAALEALASPPSVDRLVVCHGDACAPNTLLTDDGRFSGHVDLGALGVADRWADLAVATWATTWNYGPGWEEHLLAAYGIRPDPERTAYYRLLWDLS